MNRMADRSGRLETRRLLWIRFNPSAHPVEMGRRLDVLVATILDVTPATQVQITYLFYKRGELGSSVPRRALKYLPAEARTIVRDCVW